MKKNVLVFGLISGAIVSLMMVFSVLMCYGNPDYKGNMVLGYAGMLVAFSFVFVGIKNYRDKYNNGAITFGKAFKVGLLIALIASTMYWYGCSTITCLFPTLWTSTTPIC